MQKTLGAFFLTALLVFGAGYSSSAADDPMQEALDEFVEASEESADVQDAEEAEPAEASTEGDEEKSEEPTLPTGLLELQGFGYPIYVYVPENLRLNREYPMIFLAPSEEETAEESLAFILGTAKRRSYFVLAPSSLYPRDVPYQTDEWLLEVKKEIMSRFPIDSERILIMGRNSGAHYAAYLATKYPDEFAAAALLGRGFDGFFERLLEPHAGAMNQVPFVVAFQEGQESIKENNMKWLLKYQEKGYPVRVIELPPGETFESGTFRYEILDWFEEAVKRWEAEKASRGNTFKERFKKAVKEFFEV